jgi:hypothetical protein
VLNRSVHRGSMVANPRSLMCGCRPASAAAYMINKLESALILVSIAEAQCFVHFPFRQQ